MPVRNKILIVVGGLIILTVFFLFIIYPIVRDDTPIQAPEDTPTDIVQPADLVPQPPDPPPASNNTNTIVEPLTNEEMTMSEASQRAEVERLSRLFVERFGSYSNFSDFSNITGMEQFMTPSMQQYAKRLIIESTNGSQADYLGVTTRIISLKISSFTKENAAVVAITVQEEKQEGLDAEIQRTLRDGTVDLVYQGGNWLVNGLFYN